MKLRCLIVDDEPIARQGMQEYIRQTEFLIEQGNAGSAQEASTLMDKETTDLLLLDVQMPGKTGLDFLRTLKNPPMVILVTAYSEFAVEGFDLDVVDFLVKPVSYPRFLKAVTKARDYYTIKLNTGIAPAEPFFFVKCNGKLERVLFHDVLMVEGMQNYVMIHSREKKLIVYMTMTAMEAQLPASDFMRVHKSYIVSLNKIQSLDNHDLVLASGRVPVSRSLYETVRTRILGNTLAKR